MATTTEKSFWGHGMAKWGLFMGLLFGLWFAGWFLFANFAEQQIDKSLKKVADRGTIIECADRQMSGFPFRMGVRCSSASISSTRDAFRFEFGAVRSAAQIYDLTENIVEFDPPFRAWPGGTQLDANWKAMRLYANAELNGGFELASLTYEGLEAEFQNAKLTTSKGEIHLRPNPDETNSLDIAGNSVDFTALLNGQEVIPAATLSFDALLHEGYENLIQKRRPIRQLLKEAGEINLRSAIITTSKGGRIAFSGPIQLHEDGLISGDIMIGMENPSAIGKWANGINPELAKSVEGIGQGLALLGQTQQFGALSMKATKFTVKRGQVSAGFIKLGNIPPLR